MKNIISEAFEVRKFNKGQVKFSSSDYNDPHIAKIAVEVANAMGITPQEVFTRIQQKQQKMKEMEQKSPILYGTMSKNVVESELFTLFWKNADVKTNAPKFDNVTFFKLIRSIKADNDEFWPLRGFIDSRRLSNPKITYANESNNPHKVDTAAATPDGEFIFNTNFMQKLIDYAHLKGIRPKGKKYVSNGGDIPDEYAYIEFLIMHEFMHYTNEDFYYQKIIPNADPRIINWVGDFRTNYLLVKSGYEQLPIGLFNDDINYDQQKHYIEMYRLVKAEFDKMSEEEQEQTEQMMDGQSDDHKPGQERGKESDIDTKGKGVDDIDKKAKTTEKQMENSKDTGEEERVGQQRKSKSKDGRGNLGQGHNSHQGVDYSKITPTFNWQALTKRFLQTAKPKMEETYAKPHRRSVTSTEIARQVGAAAIRPAEKQTEFADARLAFVFDSSGSMSDVISKVYANAANLLKRPAFARTQSLVFKFSSGFHMYKCNFAANKAAEVSDINQKVTLFNTKTSAIFSEHLAGGTDFSAALATKISQAASKGYNCLFFLDIDILDGQNYDNFLKLLKQHARNCFVIFDSRNTYIRFRKKSGLSTPNITYFS